LKGIPFSFSFFCFSLLPKGKRDQSKTTETKASTAPYFTRIFAEMDKVKAISGQYQVRNKTNVSQLNYQNYGYN